MKILVLCGDDWHPPMVVRAGLTHLAGTEFTFDWIEDARPWAPGVMMSYPVVILARSNNVSAIDQSGWMTDDIQAAFSSYVSQGNGLLAIHSGTAGYDQTTVMRGILGGAFLHHPEQCPVTIDPLPEHPLCHGSAAFTVQDEHYFMELDAPNIDVFMITNSENGEQPGGWRRDFGSGRVTVLTPGHSLDVWLHPSFQALIRNSLLWCSKLLK
jgi:type 1 glutamine amidotransferase